VVTGASPRRRNAPAGVRGRPDLGRCLLHRRQHRHERRRQEGRAVGHGGRQSGLVAHGRPAGQLARGHAPRITTCGKIHDVGGGASFELVWKDGARRPIRPRTAQRTARHPGRAFSQGRSRQGRHRQVSRRPAGRAEGGLRRTDHRGALGLHRMPRHTRTVCLEFFGQARDAIPSIVEIKQLPRQRGKARGARARRPRAPGRALSARRRLQHQVQARRAAEDGCCSAISSARTMPRSPPPTSEVVRLANARSGEGFIAVSAEARRKFWLDRARTAAIAKHTNAFKINEDVVIPLERLGEYTDAIERINIELSIAQQARAARRARRVSSPAAAGAGRGRETSARAPRRRARAKLRACARAGSCSGLDGYAACARARWRTRTLDAARALRDPEGGFSTGCRTAASA
jgi:hypothetical protein